MNPVLEPEVRIDPSFIPTDAQLDEKLSKFSFEASTGGCWTPKDCRPRQRVAIVIPYKNRAEHLQALLYRLHPMLHRQKTAYCVFVAEQVTNIFAMSNIASLLVNLGFSLNTQNTCRSSENKCFSWASCFTTKMHRFLCSTLNSYGYSLYRIGANQHSRKYPILIGKSTKHKFNSFLTVKISSIFFKFSQFEKVKSSFYFESQKSANRHRYARRS